MREDAKNKKKVKFNTKPEIINASDYYQSTENKKSHKV